MSKKEADAEFEASKRVMLYHTDAPSGRVFVGAEAIAAACKDGWCEKHELNTGKGGKGKAADAGQ